MPAERVSMRRVREILRLKHEGGASDRQIARSLSLARSTVAVILERVAAAGLRWPLPTTMTDRVLEAMLYAGHGSRQRERRKAEPDWAHVHHELRRPGVTLMLLWEEYRQREPEGYGYSRWCELYRAWEGRLSPTMRQVHPAGERWILARLRNRRFFSLAELNRAIAELVADLNARPMRRLGINRRDLFLELDRPALKPLPAEPYQYAEWRVRRVGLDYHVDIDGHYYSVPHRLIREQLDARITERTIELFCRGERVAVHLRIGGRGRHTTIPEHMPSAHRRYAEWTIERIRADAAAIGPSTAKLTAVILESRPHPEQGYRACIGILRLARHYGADRLEAACDRGLDIGARSYGSIQSILKHGLDRRPQPQPAMQGEPLPDHPNIRGPRYYH